MCVMKDGLGVLGEVSFYVCQFGFPCAEFLPFIVVKFLRWGFVV